MVVALSQRETERFHQGRYGRLIKSLALTNNGSGAIRVSVLAGGLLDFYYRTAA